LYSELRFTVR